LKEIKLVEKVDFPQYIIIWYIDKYVFVQGLDDGSLKVPKRYMIKISVQGNIYQSGKRVDLG
jgi:hypothetical protein